MDKFQVKWKHWIVFKLELNKEKMLGKCTINLQQPKNMEKNWRNTQNKHAE